MSYTSSSVFRPSTTLAQLRGIVELLGFTRGSDSLKVPGRVLSYWWFEQKDYKSWVGVELDVYRSRAGRVTVTTRSRAGRSYWDLVQQNRALKTLRDLFGGHFVTDAGRNRYWRPEGAAPAPAQSGCYMARWRLHNSFARAQLYLSTRGLNSPIARPEPTGLHFMDTMNPRLLSNNLLLPYLVAIWEDFHKSCFAALLRYSDNRAAVLKAARLPQERLEAVAAGTDSIEDSVAGTFGFQRPTTISAAYRLLDPQLDITATLRRRYRRRRVSLFDTIESAVAQRHSFVHRGEMDTTFSDTRLKSTLADFEAAADRVYVRIFERGGWSLLRDY